MDFFHAIFLAIVQGLTEFLPVSSSGHLVIFQHWFGFKESEILFDICLHIGTLFAICGVFYKEIQSLFSSLFRFPSLLRSSGSLKNLYSQNDDIRMIILILSGTVPTGIIGIFFHKMSDAIFSSVFLVGISLIVTGIILWASRWVKTDGRSLNKMTLKDALTIGVVQGLAVLPGISRSGSTIVTGLFVGVDRETAARFSFLMSIPAILGALVLEIGGSDKPVSISIPVILTGVAISGIVGFAALKIFLRMVKQGRLYYFAPYCWILGATLLLR